MDIGVNSEFGKLKSVLLHIPTRQEFAFGDAADMMFLNKPDYDKVLYEINCYIELLESLGIQVYTDYGFKLRSEYAKDYPNLIYMKDLAIVTPDKIILCRPYHKVRQGEEKYLYKLLKHIGVEEYKIDYIPVGTHEAADVIWLSSQRLMINNGYRTSHGAALAIAEYFNDNYNISSAFISGNLNHTIPQHIQGSKHVFSLENAAIREELNDWTMNIKNVYKFKETDEIVKQFSLNVITVNENEIIMPTGCPETKAAYESLGVTCHESPMQEITKGAGGFACMTLFLNRKMI